MNSLSKDISIVASLYYSAPYIAEFLRRADESAQKISASYEIILVNDGSPDDSLTIARQFAEKDSHVVVVDLSRNFGHHKAMLAGLAHARGERIFLLDSDLEEEPEWLGAFTKALEEGNCDIIYGVQERRKGGLFERVSGALFYKFFRLMTELDLPENLVTARLMTRRYVNALLSFPEREVYLGGLCHMAGFKQGNVLIHKHHKGNTTYSLAKRLSLLVTSITSFSNKPLIMIFHCGALIFLMAFGVACWLVVRWLFFATPPSGWTSLMVSVWLLGSLIISFLGVIGIYLAKVFSETKQRPLTIVRAIYGR